MIHLELSSTDLKTFDPLSLLDQIVVLFPDLEKKRSEIYTILAELYYNALDHGILRLDSSLKDSIAGMSLYYLDRAKKLAALTAGFIQINIDYTSDTLIIVMKDSGPGFLHRQKKSNNPNKLSGRGIALLYALSKSVEYDEKGNQVTVRY